jgi:toxin ParE1/3/4
VRIEWLPTALRDRAGQLAYVAERNPRAAIDMGDAIEAAVARLADHPHSGRPGRVPGTRELVVVSGTPYVVAHRVERAAVVILRVLQGAQRWPRSLKEGRQDRNPGLLPRAWAPAVVLEVLNHRSSCRTHCS